MGIDIKGVVMFFAALFVIVFIIAVFLAYWYVALPLVALGIGGFIYWKRQKRASNMV